MFPSGKIVASDRQTGLYVLKTTFPLTDVTSGINGTVPEGYELSQNYPNPFNPTTAIGFEVPENSNVNLKVYDMEGKEVAELVNDRRDAGRYEVKFDAAKYGLSSGTYIYAIKAGEFYQSKKMTIVK